MITCRVEAVDIVDVLVLLGEDILRTTRSLSQPWDYMLTGVLMVVKHHAAALVDSHLQSWGAAGSSWASALDLGAGLLHKRLEFFFVGCSYLLLPKKRGGG